MPELEARGLLSAYWAAETFPISTEQVTVRELPMGGIIRIQGLANDPLLAAAIDQVLGMKLPEACEHLIAGQRELAWSSPREWLLFVPLADEASFLRELSDRLLGQFANATPVSDSRIAIEVSGPQAARFLSKGTGLDLHLGSFPVGRVATTRFMGLPAMIMHQSSGGYRLYFDVGFAAFAFVWFNDAAKEFASVQKRI